MKKQPDKGKITALYERLSHDDERAGESVSIENQKRILEDYAQKNGFTNIRHFTDDGVRGTTFKRPGLDAMLEEIRAGNVAILLLYRPHPPHRAGAPRLDRRRLMRDLPLAAVPDGFPGAARTGATRDTGGLSLPSAARRGQRKGVFGDFCRFPQLVRAHRAAAGCLAGKKRPGQQGRAAVLFPLRRRALRFRPRACPLMFQSGDPRAVMRDCQTMMIRK